MTSLTHTLSSLSEKATRGEWTALVQPLVAKCQVAVNFGNAAVFNKEGAQALGDLLREMADKLDAAIASARLRVSDELDAATVERCAQWHDEQAELAINSLHCGDNTQTIAAHHRRCQWHRESASAIRSLIPNSAGETTFIEGAFSDAYAAGYRPPGSPSETVQKQDSGPSEACHGHQPMMPKYEYQKDASQGGSVAYRDPAVTQDCAPAVTVSEEELARFLNPNAFKLAEAGSIYGRQQVNLATGTARALLSQFDVRGK